MPFNLKDFLDRSLTWVESMLNIILITLPLALLRAILPKNRGITIERRWVDEDGNSVSCRYSNWAGIPPPSPEAGSGKTTWYSAKSDTNISSPPVVPQAKTGHLYVHLDCSTHSRQYWMFGANNEWQSVWEGSEYPLNHDQRVLSICGNGEPSWVDRACISMPQGSKKGELAQV